LANVLKYILEPDRVYGIVVFVKTHPKSDSGYNQIVSIMEMYEMVGLDVSGHIAHEYAFL
jgi:hypothetical protein